MTCVAEKMSAQMGAGAEIEGKQDAFEGNTQVRVADVGELSLKANEAVIACEVR